VTDQVARPPCVVAPTITKLPPCAGAVLVTGSHGGLYAGRLAVLARIRAVIFHDAAVGLDGAGIASLAVLERLGIAAAAASHLSCRIGDTEDMLARGRISHANAIAGACGVEPGMDVAEAAARLETAPHHIGEMPEIAEGRLVQRDAARPLVLIDSASLADPAQDAGAVVVTGSHGGLIGGDPTRALNAAAFAAAFNAAGIGIDRAGVGRLTALDARGIAAIAIAASTAHIGEAASTLAGTISAINVTARRLGADEGMPAREVLLAWCALP
jgi:uncharacterized protein YunC (DUF1805 family)